MVKITKKEYNILYTLLNNHLNLIGEITVNTKYQPIKDDYLWELENLENKLVNLKE